MTALEPICQIDAVADKKTLLGPLHEGIERLRLRPGPGCQGARRRGMVHAHEWWSPGGGVAERTRRERSPSAVPDGGDTTSRLHRIAGRFQEAFDRRPEGRKRHPEREAAQPRLLPAIVFQPDPPLHAPRTQA